MLTRTTLRNIALAGALMIPGIASAASAVATTDVNLRAGPSTSYPAVNVVASGDDVEVFGCLSNRSWCDVDYYGQRGWMSSNYLAYLDRGQRYSGVTVVERIRAPVVSFSVGTYWDRHYRSRPFYRERDRFSRGDFREVRQEIRQDRREDRREFRQDRREDRREFRQEVREDRREFREDRRDDRAEDRGRGRGEGGQRGERRQDRAERQELRLERREAR